MLRTLRIRHVALIDSLELDFTEGLNIITGETGAGKSILMDALLAVLGERTSSDFVSSGHKKAIVEAEFHTASIDSIREILVAHEYDWNDGQIIIRRELSSKGSSRYFINDSPAQLQLVKQVGDLLVDFHGQHEHQSILRSATQLRVLDGVAHNSDVLAAYQRAYAQLSNLVDDHLQQEARHAERIRQRDYQQFQLEEIDAIDPRDAEDEELELELQKLSHAEEIFTLSDATYHQLYAAESSAHDSILTSVRHLQQLEKIDPALADQRKELESVAISIDEIAKWLKKYATSVEVDPVRIEHIRERLLLLQRLRRKYGSVAEARKVGESLRAELSFIDSYDHIRSATLERIDQCQRELGKAAVDLSSSRRAAAPVLDAAVTEALKDLGIPSAQFHTLCTTSEIRDDEHLLAACHKGHRYRVSPTGCDEVQFVASMNSGEDVKPLQHVLSGGEASRLLLAVKSVLAASDSVPLLVFDEIDVGVSGRIARKVGSMMRSIAEQHQVIAITHQAQIASLAHHHISVEKTEGKSGTSIHARVLKKTERVAEVAKLISGEEVTSAALRSARELIPDTP